MSRTWAILISGLVFLPTNVDARQNDTRPPNIILFLADDVGDQAFNAYGGVAAAADFGEAPFLTPNIDRLAAEGMRFTRAYATAVCTPTRVQLLTGKHNFRNYDTFGVLDPSQRTLANYLKDAGYATALAGKWQLSTVVGAAEGPPYDLPHHFGFDEYVLWQLGGPDNRTRYKNPVLSRSSTGDTHRYEGAYGPDLLQEFVLDFIERHRDGPFFVFYATPLVHDPFQPPPGHPDYEAHDPETVHDPRYFADMVNYMDRQIGELVQKLEELGIRENTLIIFMGDNGTVPEITHVMSDGRRLPGNKGKVTEGGIHVALIASWPGTIVQGEIRDELVDIADVYLALLDAGGVVGGMAERDSYSLYPTLVTGARHPRQWIFQDYYRNRGPGPEAARLGGGRVVPARYAHDGRYKLYSDGRFYDYVADYLEEHPLAEEELTEEARAARDRLAAVIRQMEAEIRAVEALRPAPEPATSAGASGRAGPGAGGN